MSSKVSHLWIVLAIAAAVALAFLPALSADFLDWDDQENVTRNPRIQELTARNLSWMLTGFRNGHWHPLTWFSLALDHHLWGLKPAGYHATNLFLHGINAVLVYALALFLLRRHGPLSGASEGVLRLAAAGAALFFAVHPLRVESVVWITERRDVLSGLLLLASLLAYLRYALGEGRARVWFGLSLAAFALSLSAKAWGITLPAVLLVLDVHPLRRLGRRSLVRLALEKGPYLLLAGVAALLALHAQRVAGAMDYVDLAPLQRLAQAAYGLCYYPLKTLAPTNLSPLYPLRPDLSPLQPAVLASSLGAVGVTLLLVAARARRPAWLTTWLCYGIVVAPVLGLTQSGVQMVADRYSYLACIPFAVLLGAGLVLALSASPRLTLAASTLVLAGLAVQTHRLATHWQDPLSLWSHAVALDPDNHVAQVKLALLLQDRREGEAALAALDRAVAAAPFYAVAYNNRGQLRVSLGADPGLARPDLERAVELDPDYVEAYMNLAAVDLKLRVRAEERGQTAEAERLLGTAIESLERALAADPPRGLLPRIQQALDGLRRSGEEQP